MGDALRARRPRDASLATRWKRCAPARPCAPAGADSVSLAPALSAAQACGGHLWADSQPAGGARVSLVLPLRAVGGRADWSSLRQTVEAHLPDSRSPSKSLLLLVEDPDAVACRWWKT